MLAEVLNVLNAAICCILKVLTPFPPINVLFIATEGDTADCFTMSCETHQSRITHILVHDFFSELACPASFVLVYQVRNIIFTAVGRNEIDEITACQNWTWTVLRFLQMMSSIINCDLTSVNTESGTEEWWFSLRKINRFCTISRGHFRSSDRYYLFTAKILLMTICAI
jgi:hypothetical protein